MKDSRSWVKRELAHELGGENGLRRQGDRAHRRANYSIEVEQSVLSAMLQDPHAVQIALGLLQAEDFYDEQTALIFRAMLRLVDRGRGVDPVTVGDELQTSGTLEAAGGKEMLGFLYDALPTSVQVSYHAQIVREKAQTRQLEHALMQGIQDLRDGGSGALRTTLPRLKRDIDAATMDADATAPRLLSLASILSSPPVEHLVDGMFPLGGACELHGTPGSGKSFLALALALSVASGTAFLGRAVRHGPVVYVCAEGETGLGARVRAWLDDHGMGEVLPIDFCPDAVNLLDETEMARFIRRVKLGTKPVLVVFDTLHRCMAGGDENSAKDMGRAIASVDRVRKEFGSTVLLLHHVALAADRERGSGSLRGAMDAMYHLKTDGRRLTLICEKNKEGERMKPLDLMLTPRGESCVLTLTAQWELGGSGLPDAQRALLHSLSRDFLADGASCTQWLKAANVAETSFYRARTALVKGGFVIQTGAGRHARYLLAATGRQIVAANFQ